MHSTISPAVSPPFLSLGTGIVRDGEGRAWHATLTIPSSSHACDVTCELVPAEGAADDLDEVLWDDSSVISGLNQLLASFGYCGPEVGRAESGMQGSRKVVLEAHRAFEAFAVRTLGWMPADGLEIWRRTQLRADFRDAMLAQSRELILPESATAAWHIPMHAVLAAVEQVVAGESSTDPAFFEQVYDACDKRGNLKWLAVFLQEHADTAWAPLSAYAQRKTVEALGHPALMALRAGKLVFPLSPSSAS